MLKVGVVGYGYWGPNIVRNFQAQSESEVVLICDVDAQQLERANKTFPHIAKTDNISQLVNSPQVDAIAVATPVSTHFALAKEALDCGKHVFVEKPFTRTSYEAEQLIGTAASRNLKIMVGHVFLFSGAVRKIKELVGMDALGEIYYYDSTRVNLGLFQPDVSVIWDLAPHDFSIMAYLLGARPDAVAAHGIAHFNRQRQEIAYVIAYFGNNLIAHFTFNWLSPVKIRRTLIGGSKQMLVWDDLEPDEKIKVYDKGIVIDTKEDYYEVLVKYRRGSMFAPLVENEEPLKIELHHFVDSVLNDKPVVNDGVSGLRVVELLEACDESIRCDGRIVKV